MEVVLHKCQNISYIGLGMNTDRGVQWTLLQKFCRKNILFKENKTIVPSNYSFYLNLVKIWKHDTFLWLKPVNRKWLFAWIKSIPIFLPPHWFCIPVIKIIVTTDLKKIISKHKQRKHMQVRKHTNKNHNLFFSCLWHPFDYVLTICEPFSQTKPINKLLIQNFFTLTKLIIHNKIRRLYCYKLTVWISTNQ